MKIDWERNLIGWIVSVICVVIAIWWMVRKQQKGGKKKNVKDESVTILMNWDEQVCDKKRMKNIMDIFSKNFNGSKPDFIVRSPGRVNLIGEHIDYCGYSVFPMAINKDILLAVQITTNSNSNNNNYKDKTIIRLTNREKTFDDIILVWEDLCTMDRKILVSNTHWSKYFIAAAFGVIDILQQQKQPQQQPKGNICLNILVHGNLAKGSGLSSSAALVCGSTVLLLHTFGHLKNMSRTDIAKICMECERYVGVNTGGMDQSIVMTGRRDFAKYVSFVPELQTCDVPLPQPPNDPYVFVICNSLSEHTLTDDMGTRNYNTRVAECRMASVLLAKHLKIKDWHTIHTLRELQDRMYKNEGTITDLQMSTQLTDLLFKCMNSLESDPYTLEQIEQELFESDSLDGNNNNNNNNNDNDKTKSKEMNIMEIMTGLKRGEEIIEKIRTNNHKLYLQQRALHVYSEALRVVQFKKICEQYVSTSKANIVKEMSNLMNASHNSCRDQYDCSSEQLEMLRNTCLEGGASGCRLTGAGWGGCVVGIVPCKILDTFKEHVQKHFYANFPSVPLDVMFETSPADGVYICLCDSPQQ